MIRQCKLSNVAKEYLESFYCILDEMIRGMTEAELSDSISYNFIVQMIPHHCGAIEMSQNLLKYTTNVPLQNIALQIIEEQTKSIENMRAIQCICEERCNPQQDLCLYQRRTGQVMQQMFCRMGNAPGTNEINADFIQEMIPHHEGAIAMSKNTLQYDICPELVPILEAIIISQKRGVRQMQEILRCIR